MRLVNTFKIPIEKVNRTTTSDQSTLQTFYSTARNDHSGRKKTRTNMTQYTSQGEQTPDLTIQKKATHEPESQSFVSPHRKNLKLSYLSEQSLSSLRKNLPDLDKNNHKSELVQEAGETREEKTPEKGEGYKEYRKNMKNFVVDKDMNYLYFKAASKNDEATRMFFSSELMKDMSKKYEHMKPEAIAKLLIKEDNRPKTASNYMKNKQHIAEMSAKTKKTIDIKMDIIKSTKIAEEAKKEIDKLTTSNNELIDKISIENADLKEENEHLRRKNEDLASENGVLLRKCQLITQELMKLRDEDEALRKKFSVLETFRPAYNLLCSKFPNEDVRAIIAKFDRLAEYVVEYTRSIGNLEGEITQLRKENDKLREVIESKETVIRNEEIQRSKIITTYRNEVDSRDLILNENASFKDMYFKLFNRVLTMYLEWTQVITVYDGKNKPDLKPDLSDPFHLIDLMSKIIRVSTDDSAQKYLTKIIVSANQLVRRYFPFAINEKFDPDKIYERTHKYIDKLQRELKRLNPKSEELKPDQ